MKKKQTGARHGRAAIYARYSSHNQREASIEQQVKACRATWQGGGDAISQCIEI